MDLTIGQLIKLILGVLVFVAVIAGFYLFFDNYVFEFFKTGTDDSGKTSESIEEQNLNEEINKCGTCGDGFGYCDRQECEVDLGCEFVNKFAWFNECVIKVTGGTG